MTDRATTYRLDLSHLTKGLDLTSLGDRALFLVRVELAFCRTRVPQIIDHARGLGIELAGNASREEAVRAIAVGWLAGKRPLP